MICGPGNSSAWVSDYQTIYPAKNIDFFKHDKYKQLQVDDSELLKNIKNLHIHGGGEPLLSDNHIELLKKIKSVKGLSDVHVYYNINGTKRVSTEVLDIWAECQLVELYFSIDDIGERFNYQRTGADWDGLVENLNWYKENMPVNHMFKINCTWGYLNLFYLNELVDWYNNNFNTNRLGDPVNLIFQKAIDMDFKFSLDTVSTSLKIIFIEKFKNYPRLLELVHTLKEDDDETHNEFWASVEKLDAVRGVKFRDVCPELSSLLS
jgi:hypothetical protein